jgi:WD40 repeat protein
VAFSPDGKTLATGSDDDTIRLWDVAAGKNTATLTSNSDVSHVAFNPARGNILASGGDNVDQTVRLWNVTKEATITTFPVSGRGLRSMAFSPDGKNLATVGEPDPAVRLWKVAG